MHAALRSVKKMPRLARLSARMQERIARSSRVFLLGILIACGIEVLADWHATLSEVAGLRDLVKLRGQNYVAVLAKAGSVSLAGKDGRELERLASGVFDDRDVVFARFVDRSGGVAFERLAEPYGSAFEREHGMPFAKFYTHQLERDAKGIIEEPDGLRSRMENSRHRDVAQAYGDFVKSIVGRFVKPEARPPENALILYQDRLYTEHAATRERDATVTYAIARVEDTARTPIGAVFVAFRMDGTNAAVRGKYLKGLGIVVFFVALILVQNVVSRREKLRWLDIQARDAAAKQAVRAVLPEPATGGGVRVAGSMAQAAGTVDGALWDHWIGPAGADLIVVDPQGESVASAAISLHVRAMWRRLREASTESTLLEEAATLGEAAAQIPLTQPIGLLLLRLRGSALEALAGDVGGVRVVTAGGARRLEESPVEATPAGLTPIRALRGELPPGSTLVVAADGLTEAARRLDADQVCAFLQRAGLGAARERATLVSDAVAWARGKNPTLERTDLIVIALERLGSV